MNGIFSLQTCPSSVQQEATKSFTITPSGGVAPYKLELLINDVSVYTIPYQNGAASGTVQFNNIGTFSVRARITDACSEPAPQTYLTPICTVKVTAPPLQYHNECVNNLCKQVAGVGTDQCTTVGASCGQPACTNPSIILAVS